MFRISEVLSVIMGPERSISSSFVDLRDKFVACNFQRVFKDQVLGAVTLSPFRSKPRN